VSDEFEELQDTYPGAVTFSLGDSNALCVKLNTLVREGKKKATCGALAEFEGDSLSLPKPGRCDIATDWDGTPAFVVRTKSVEHVRFCDVTEEMALAEGEDENLEGWRKGHKAYFERNGGFDPDMMLVFERFEMVEDLANR
jgi:uncharacterized protein YhfF